MGLSTMVYMKGGVDRRSQLDMDIHKVAMSDSHPPEQTDSFPTEK